MSYRLYSFVLVNETRLRLPPLKWQKLKERLLSKNYELSLVFVGPKAASELARRYKKEKKVPSVLAFPISPKAGEVFLNLKQIKKEAKTLGYSFFCYIAFLYIHGILHLAGYSHSAEKQRKKIERKTTSELKRLGCILDI